MLITSYQVIATNNNPFNKTIVVTASHDIAWQFGEQTATKSVQGEEGNWYHLFYDGLRLRLRLTTSAQDSPLVARKFEEFAIYDVKIDGRRVDVFQWCLNHQDRHNRFLQQGLSVKKEICQNQGEQGTFVMRLTQDTIATLNNGDVIEYELEPFRTKVHVKFSIDDFDQVNSEFKKQHEAKLAASRPKVEPVIAVPVKAAVVSAPKPKPKCKLHPPAGFSEINSIEYVCDDITERINAQATIDLKVDQIYEQRSKAAAEAEYKRLEAERQRKQAEAARLAEEARKKEQAALAASAEIQAALSSDIAKKMIAVCEKKWAEGEHRCYCEKYIKYAPGNIKSNPECN